MIFSMWLATSRAFPSSAATQGAAWQEQNLVERIASETGLPLTVFAIDARGDPSERPLEDCQVVEVDLGVRRKREL
jgi:hypothetical protein